MDKNAQSVQFLLEEYKDLYQNVIHLENKLFNHLSFYTTLFLGAITASIAILQFSSNGMSVYDLLGFLSLLFALLFTLGRFEIHMTTELRIRKMKYIEGISAIRGYFVEIDDSISKYLVLPKGINKAPPYLRVGSQDWYQLIYLCVMNCVSLFVFWVTIPYFVGSLMGLFLPNKLIPTLALLIIWIILGAVLFMVCFWEFSYKRIMDICSFYDKDREKRMNSPIEYDLLERELSGNIIKWSISDWIRFIDRKSRNSS